MMRKLELPYRKSPGSTFFNLPISDTCRKGKPALLSVPADALVTEHTGAAEGPAALRTSSLKVGKYHVGSDTLIARESSGAVDLGDLAVNRFDPEESLNRLYQVTKELFQHEAIPLIIGGDHALTYAVVCAAAEKYSDLHLLHIDAHYDATDPEEHGCRINHGTYIRNLISEGILPGTNVLQIGMREYQWSGSGYRFLRDKGVWMQPMAEFERAGYSPLLEKLQEECDKPFYISLDIDSIDPAFAPGTGELMPGGFYGREILTLTREIFSRVKHIVGADLVELNPSRDPDGRSCSLAAQLLATMLDHLAQHKHKE